MRIGTLTTSRGGKLAYVYSTKGRRLREPWRIERLIVTVWNWTACRLFGHDRILDGVVECYDEHGTFPCTACCARLVPKKRIQ